MLLQAGADKEAKDMVSSPSLCQLSNGYMLAVAAAIIIGWFHGFDEGICYRSQGDRGDVAAGRS